MGINWRGAVLARAALVSGVAWHIWRANPRLDRFDRSQSRPGVLRRHFAAYDRRGYCALVCTGLLRCRQRNPGAVGSTEKLGCRWPVSLHAQSNVRRRLALAGWLEPSGRFPVAGRIYGHSGYWISSASPALRRTTAKKAIWRRVGPLRRDGATLVAQSAKAQMRERKKGSQRTHRGRRSATEASTFYCP